MTSELTRRGVLAGGFALGACAQHDDWRRHYADWPNDPRIAAIEARIGGRVGVTAWNVNEDLWITHRAREYFAMCSTFKWVLAANQLRLAANGGPQLSDQLPFGESDLLEYAPTAREHLSRGWMTIEEACAGAVVLSASPERFLRVKSPVNPGCRTCRRTRLAGRQLSWGQCVQSESSMSSRPSHRHWGR